MALEQVIYDPEEVKGFSDEELYRRLCESWGSTSGKLAVWGKIKNRTNFDDRKLPTLLLDIKSLQTGLHLEYPINVRLAMVKGVFISFKSVEELFGIDDESFISCELALAPQSEREKHENPFECNVVVSSVRRLIKLPEYRANDIINGDESIFLDDAVYKLHLQNVQSRIDGEVSALKAEFEREESSLKAQISSYEVLLQQTQEELNKNNNILSQARVKTQELEEKNTEWLRKIALQKKVEETMSKKIERLKAYVESKALFLKSFEFLDDEDFDIFVGNRSSAAQQGKHISFSQTLDSKYSNAVSYIQAHLKERDILYPRHIIENFLTLIRTNDLIILAGDSGSGKTNLVQSFAKAIGGVSKIIPVKPNWTSSEDLLGYYNPLEKKYLATPFLEALIEAKQNPDIPYFICLDEMNLARVEYYFADFLSKLEERNEQPTIQLYSDDEAAHVLAELKGVVSVISNAQEKFSKNGIVDFVALLQDEEINAEMKRSFGFSDKDSLIKYHGDIRRMLAGVLGTPSSITIPANVRIIGAINIDETTHYLSPKILDRAHVMKFKSPLLTDWDAIFDEIDSYGLDDVNLPLGFDIAELGERSPYPKFERSDEFCELFTTLNREVFDPLGVEFGMRTIRQGLNYIRLFSDVNDNKSLAINNFIVHKVLPKFTFDGGKQVGDYSKVELVGRVFLPRLESLLDNQTEIAAEFSCTKSVERLVKTAEANDGVVNYWA
ncbi:MULTISPECIES: McrB family protein [Pantoea]|uniref:5-methylcytosine-specific restriction related enzyme n=2 Tax=Pantoea TaxID=53335 RepID=A0A0U3UMX6_9GAMM|nr:MULTISPECIES: AAA family ATPase [Pantoea]ALV90954.1 5-methylcytosine-specific restriction related enzyme [Pantoea vagans]KHJ69396.1 5-methylcytosine-specific restriction related enzyme [Pantoea rodasii]